ncbi:hypothetical protein AB1Y20_006837 [Prymnesium parvum]|uniref:Amine oxidase domain-containing protein n=1 Tax=Prymnesium parvum TaxID=97485 RepID=A0AB34IZJ6_PRYPA
MAASKTPPLLAIVGGGIAGACAASLLAETCEVVLFDQGRRGPGGRASHRSEPSPLPPRADGAAQTAPASECSTLEFDHGCQFFRADTPEMKGLVEEWERHGWVAPWRGRFGSLGGSGGEAAADFFGLPADAAPVYAGVGGMHWLPRRILAEARVEVRAQTRVASVERREGGKHELYGVVGEGAYHDTPESKAAASVVSSLGVYDAVLFTDISSAFGEWHRASAGVPEEVARCVRDRVRTPLFSCMVAFDSPLASVIQLDGFNVCGKSPLWWASCSQSKPGFPAGAAECWTLISTPAFAAEEIGRELMQDPQTGAFKPQSNDYLNSVPGPQLLAAFVAGVQKRSIVVA